MRASEFVYVRPGSLPEAVEAARAPGATVTAGGQSVVPALVLRERRTATLVDVSGLPELRGLAVSPGEIVIGAAEPLRTLERSADLGRACPLLQRAIATVAAMAIRSRCTLGGSVAWADPTSQLPATLAVLGTTVCTTERSVPVLDVLRTGLAPGELVVELRVPTPGPHGHGLAHVRRTHITWPAAGAVAFVDRAGTRLGLYGAAPTSVLVEAPSVEEALAAVTAAIDPFDDEKATAAYRRQVLPVLAERASTEAKDMFDERD